MVGKNDSRTADCGGQAGILKRHYALETKWPVPLRDHPADVVPVHCRIKHFREITRNRNARIFTEIDMRLQLGEPELLVNQVVNQLHGFPRELHRARQTETERNLISGAKIAFSVAAGYTVHCQYHDLDSRVFGPLHHRAIPTAVLVKIELMGMGRVMPAAQFLNADRAQ